MEGVRIADHLWPECEQRVHQWNQLQSVPLIYPTTGCINNMKSPTLDSGHEALQPGQLHAQLCRLSGWRHRAG